MNVFLSEPEAFSQNKEAVVKLKNVAEMLQRSCLGVITIYLVNYLR
jgi:hypothetical protein